MKFVPDISKIVSTSTRASLNYVLADGRQGSLADFGGRELPVVIASLGCAKCQSVIEAVSRLSETFLVLTDGSRPISAWELREWKLPENVIVAGAPLPEIYLGLKLKRGVWIRFPSLVLLDRDGTVWAFSNNVEELMDCHWIENLLRSFVGNGRSLDPARSA